VLKELFVLWVHICPIHASRYRNDLRRAWAHAKKEICCQTEEGAPVTKWHKVVGVFSNIIANL